MLEVEKHLKPDCERKVSINQQNFSQYASAALYMQFITMITDSFKC